MKMLQPGADLPDVVSTDQDGQEVKLRDYLGKRVVVFFYPRANTPGCTAEACNLRDHFGELIHKGYALIGVSDDSVKKQKNFRDKFEFPFPLLADESHEVIDAFGVWGPKKFMGKEFDGLHRTTFVFSEQGVLERVIDKVRTKDHALQILEEN